MTPTQTIALRLGITLVAAGSIAHAQFPARQDNADEAEEPRRYTVEMIIFEYAEDVGLGSEIFVPDLVQPELDMADDVLDAPVDELPGAEPADEETVDVELDIRTLQRDELTMGDTLERLERLDAYRPLMHFGWSQATVEEDLSPELPLARFGSPPPGLDGDLKLYLNRFLHLVVNVSKLAPEGALPMRSNRAAIESPTGRFDSATERTTFNRDFVVEYEPLRYRISEDRIMKNGETRYYDHPKIGVIAKVTRVEEADELGSAGF